MLRFFVTCLILVTFGAHSRKEHSPKREKFFLPAPAATKLVYVAGTALVEAPATCIVTLGKLPSCPRERQLATVAPYLDIQPSATLNEVLPTTTHTAVVDNTPNPDPMQSSLYLEGSIPTPPVDQRHKLESPMLQSTQSVIFSTLTPMATGSHDSQMRFGVHYHQASTVTKTVTLEIFTSTIYPKSTKTMQLLRCEPSSLPFPPCYGTTIASKDQKSSMVSTSIATATPQPTVSTSIVSATPQPTAVQTMTVTTTVTISQAALQTQTVDQPNGGENAVPQPIEGENNEQ